MHDELAVGYALGHVAAADPTVASAIRARLVCPLLPGDLAPATPTAAWIYTGRWPSPRLKRLCAVHPMSRRRCVVYRAQLEGEYLRELGDFAIPTAVRTALDLLTIEESGVAVECVIHLLRSGLNPKDLLLHSKRERRWRDGPFIRKAVKALKTYIEETK